MSDQSTETVFAVERTLQSMARAVSTGNIETWSRLWHPDARQFAPNTPAVCGRYELVGAVKGWFEQWNHDMVIRPAEVQLAGNWAFASGTLTLRSVSRRVEKTELLTGQFLAVLAAGGERWLLYRFCYNSSVPLAGDPQS
jgi:ketosteroid isomerase-like protein